MSRHDDDDLRRLRDEEGAADDEQSRAPDEPPAGALRFAAITVTQTAYPSAAACFFAVKRRNVAGTETEGSVGTEATAGATFFAYNLGNAIPPAGARVEVVFVPNRYVFTYGSPRAT